MAQTIWDRIIKIAKDLVDEGEQLKNSNEKHIGDNFYRKYGYASDTKDYCLDHIYVNLSKFKKW
jgi:hypothetical protein